MPYILPTEISHNYLIVSSDGEQFDSEHKKKRLDLYILTLRSVKKGVSFFNLVEHQTCHLSPSNVGVCFVPSRLKFIPLTLTGVIGLVLQ